MRRWILLVGLGATTAYAQPDPKLTQALQLYEEGERLYKLQKYEEALAKYESSYLLSNEPALLFNIGQCYRMMGKPNEALRSYRAYIKEVPDSPDKDTVNRLIDQMEELVSRGISAEDLQKAAKLFEEAEAFYQIQKFDKALAKYEESYLLSKEPVLLFNVGQCHRQLGKFDDAIKSYRAYLRENPDPEGKATAEKLISEMEALRGQPASTSTSEPVSPQQERARLSPLSLGLFGGAVALGGVSGGFGLLALQSKKDAQALLTVTDAADIDAAKVKSLTKKSERRALASDISLGVALGSAVAGFLLPKKQEVVSLSITPQGQSIQVSFVW